MEIKIIRSAHRRRTVSASLRNGEMHLRVPLKMAESEVKKFAAKFEEKFRKQLLRKTLNQETELPKMAAKLNKKYFGGKLRLQSIEYVSNQNRLYGSCTPHNATIRIATQVAPMPEWVKEYVVMHELCHLVESNHSARFWALVNQYPLSERARGFLIAKGLESAELALDEPTPVARNEVSQSF